MEYEAVASAIGSLGFPIACVIGMGYIMVYILKFLLNEIVENRKERSMFIETLNKFNIRFEVLEEKVDHINDKIK